MISFDKDTDTLNSTDLGRVASDFFINCASVKVFNGMIKPLLNEEEILTIMSNANEFQQLKVRDDEKKDLDYHSTKNCKFFVNGDAKNVHRKVNILMQTYLSKGRIGSYPLMSQHTYVSKNCRRIARALFEIVLQKGWPLATASVLKVALMFERQMWHFENPFLQFIWRRELIKIVIDKELTIDGVREMDSKELEILIQGKNAAKLSQLLKVFPEYGLSIEEIDALQIAETGLDEPQNHTATFTDLKPINKIKRKYPCRQKFEREAE
ncbi:hypothetical protein QYM36_018771 [Artemia franciscana]|uniref:SEC63 domain-containing protein n=1 Tax=Artemia franciscana TaxID=6661 RepID=A0AA88KUB1_ARTSF|nr:hypothetical protein QYM36_018771 [Artemia franciscana]